MNALRPIRSGWWTVATAATAWLLIWTVPAVAQQTPPPEETVAAQPSGPYRGLFGMGSPARRGGSSLDMYASAYGEYGNTAQGELATTTPTLATGWFLGVNGGLTFRKSGQHSGFVLLGDTTFRYYRTTGQTTAPRVHTELGFDTRTGDRGRNPVRLSVTADWEPYYILSVFGRAPADPEGTAIVPTNRDDVFDRQARTIVGESFSFDHPMSARTFVRVFENARETFSSTSTLNVSTVQAGGGFGYRMSRYASFVLGYSYRTGQLGQPQRRLETHDINVGIDYRRPLMHSRRTTFGFTTGTAALVAQPSWQWQVVGGVNLRHEFNSGWFVQTDFTRNTQFVEGFADLFFVNTLQASLGGFAGRRVELLAASGYSRGTVGSSAQPYDAVRGSARMRVALARFVALDVEGLTNRQSFSAQIVMPGAVPALLNRWSVRCNVAVWLPLAR